MTAYPGTERKLVLAFDIGTTYSGISYRRVRFILDPGEIPDIKGVNRYPGQEHAGGDSKIPTVIYYDTDGEVCAVGAEATSEEMADEASENDWHKAEWFKMHLRPNNPAARQDNLPPLPPNKTVVEVMGDYMRYLHHCAKIYIQDTHPGGIALWESLANNANFVLSHPNGWEGAQQVQMRRAAILGGLVSNEDAGARIRFVTEGEASLHFCVRNGLFGVFTRINKSGGGVLIVDAGGGTIDLSAYSEKSSSEYEEIAPAQCHLMGSITVTQNAHTFIQDLLDDSKYADVVDHITECFDKSTKLRFKGADDPAFIKFGTPKDRDVDLGIRSGQLRLKGADVASFFDPSVQCIIQAIVEMRQASLEPISHVFLVGGFGASDYLFSKLKQALERLGLDFCRPDTHLSKAVADGAISFYTDHIVSVRVSKRIYGCKCDITYDPNDMEHVRRVSRRFIGLSGEASLGESFSVILPENEQVSEKKEFRKNYVRRMSGKPPAQLTIAIVIFCYRGHDSNPQWLDVDSDNYSAFCTVTANIPGSCVVQRTSSVKKYYEANFSIILAFGLAELQAQIAWEEGVRIHHLPSCPLLIVTALFRVKRRGVNNH
ncbi:hypothetical protein BD779DRAFT_1441940 [Infundibulicybe gibba]|nr:hypothetical protein BD779DRAFT_1441940 [Infundibulicybe gibba]